MDDTMVLEIASQAMMAAAKLAAPVLLTSLLVGLLVGLVQSATQLNEPTLAFVPKFIAVGGVLLLSGGWMMQEMISFTEGLFDSIPRLVA
ncbi:MAG: flagellar biosynthesis protein FliQ [Acidimicrobiales bacterium]|jgi:flagellar biosynthetic protein FliQ